MLDSNDLELDIDELVIVPSLAGRGSVLCCNNYSTEFAVWKWCELIVVAFDVFNVEI